MDTITDEMGDKLENMLGSVERLTEEAIKEVFHRFPWDAEFTLTNGAKCTIRKFVEPRIFDGRWEFGFDVRIKGVPGPDHIEFYVKQTGGGGFVG